MPESGSSGGKESVKEKNVYEFGHTVNSIPERESTKRRDQTPLPPSDSKTYQRWYDNMLPHCSYHYTYFLLCHSHPHLSLIVYEYPFPAPKIQNRNPHPEDTSSSPVVTASEIDLEISSVPLPPTSSAPADVDEVQEVDKIVGIK